MVYMKSLKLQMLSTFVKKNTVENSSTQNEALVWTCGHHINQCGIAKEYINYCYSEAQQYMWINTASELLTTEQWKYKKWRYFTNDFRDMEIHI